MEVLTALGDAENDLYSANFADYAGGGGTKVRTLLCRRHVTVQYRHYVFTAVPTILSPFFMFFVLAADYEHLVKQTHMFSLFGRVTPPGFQANCNPVGTLYHHVLSL